jgi:hypothetical protein
VLLETWEAQMHNLRHDVERCHHDWVVIGLERIQDQDHEWVQSFEEFLLLVICWNILKRDNRLIFKTFFETLEAETSHDSATDLLCLLAADGLEALVPVHVDLEVAELGLMLVFLGWLRAQGGAVVSELLLVINLYL